MGGWCEKFSNYMTESNYMGGWYFDAWKGKKEYYLPKKREVFFIKSSQKKRLELSKLQRKRPFLFMPNRQNSDVFIEYW